jgi:hypothetical protein
MGWWPKSVSVAKVVFTLGGSERVRLAKQHRESARYSYERILSQAANRSKELTGMLHSLGSLTKLAFKRLRTAQRILCPSQKRTREMELAITVPKQEVVLSSIEGSRVAIREFAALEAAASGTVVGTVLGVGSWTAVSLLGTASTGVAIGALHGAAATTATLAWFGGGSLATGGLGMLGGSVILGGVAFLPLLVFPAWLTHSEANRIKHETEEIERINQQNRKAVEKLEDRVLKVCHLVPKFEASVEQLTADVARIQKILFRYGWLSRLWRWTRWHFVGYYYDAREMKFVEELATLIDRFILQFKEQKNLLAEV